MSSDFRKRNNFFKRGRLAFEAGQFEKAIHAFNKVIEWDPKDANAFTFRGLAQRELRNFEAALNDLKQVVGIGDVAFWPPGKALCLFFGQTPMSTRDEIRPASGVDVFGKLLVEPKLLKVVKPGQSINLAKVQDLS